MPAVHRDEVLLVQTAAVVEERRLLDAPCQAHVVFAAGAADGGKLPVAVHIDLDLAFAPPLARVQVADADHRADEAALLLPLRQQLEVLLLGGRVLAAEEHVQPAHVFGVTVAERVVDLVEDRRGLAALDRVLVGDGHFHPLDKRHRKPDVHPGRRTHRVDRRVIRHHLAVGEAEEIAHRTLDAGMFLAVVPAAQHQGPKILRAAAGGHPDVADCARALDVAKLDRLARLDRPAGRALPPHAQSAGRLAALARCAGGVLETDRAGNQPRVEQIGLCDQVHRLLCGCLGHGRHVDNCRNGQQCHDRENPMSNSHHHSLLQCWRTKKSLGRLLRQDSCWGRGVQLAAPG